MTYKVIRFMEYTYGSVEQADADMAHWHAPANGSISHGPGGVHIRSAMIQYPVADESGDKASGFCGSDELHPEHPIDATTQCIGKWPGD